MILAANKKTIDIYEKLQNQVYSDEIIKWSADLHKSVVGTVGNIWVQGFLSCGSTWGLSYRAIALSIEEYAIDDTVGTLHLHFASGGGEVEGISLVSNAIRDCPKPVIAIVEGQCCSGAYWIASQCDEIRALESAEIGSVGVCTYSIKIDDVVQYYTSSNAQNKNSSEEKEIVRELNAVEDLFFEQVAEGRGWKKDEVADITEHGRTFLATVAKEKGIIDILITKDYNKSKNGKEKEKTMNDEELKTLNEKHSKEVLEVSAQAVAEERKRISELAELCGGEELQTYILSGQCAGDVAVEILKKNKAAQKEHSAEYQQIQPRDKSADEEVKQVATQMTNVLDEQSDVVQPSPAEMYDSHVGISTNNIV